MKYIPTKVMPSRPFRCRSHENTFCLGAYLSVPAKKAFFKQDKWMILLTPRTRQYSFFGFLLCVLTVLAPWLYLTMNQDLALFRKGEKQFFSGNYEKAAQYFIASIQRGVPTPKALNLLGDSYLSMGKSDQALEVFLDIRSMAPHDLNAMVKLAQVYFINRQAQTALSLLEEVLEQRPDHKIAMLWKARILAGKGDFDQAITIYTQILGE